MIGRYGGNDAFNKFLLWGYLVILLVGALTGLEWLWYVGFVAFAYNIFRMFSRNIAARQKENIQSRVCLYGHISLCRTRKLPMQLQHLPCNRQLC